MYRKLFILLGVILILAVAGFATYRVVSALDPGPPSGSGVQPSVLTGNASCADAGYGFGFKIDNSPNGTFTFTSPPGSLTGGAPSDSANSVTISNSDGFYFDWSSTLPIDAVIVKGGPNSDLFEYSPEDDSDSDLHSPINASNGQLYGISHIEFCYDYEVSVTKTANTTFTRTWSWTVQKSVTPATWDLFRGDSGTSRYTVTLTKTGYTDSAWAVSGTISIYNPAPAAVLITGITDTVSPSINATVTCPAWAVLSQSTLVCTYSSSLPDGSNRTNTAVVTTGAPGYIGGGQDSADVIFGDPTTTVNGTVSVSDTYAGSLGSFSDSGSTTYDRAFTCDGDSGTHGNTATIVETGQTASASVTVNCHALQVTKDAQTSLTRTWNWTISKGASPDVHHLFAGTNANSSYTVSVDKIGYTDSNWAVNGNISVYNPAPMAATINGVSDAVSGVGAASVNCGVSFPYSLAAGGTLNCTYSLALPDASSRTNTATATLQNYSYSHLGAATPGGTTNFTGSANVNFSSPTITEVNAEIHVQDVFDGGAVDPLGTATDDKTFPSYPRNFACSSDPAAYTGGHYQYTKPNTASIVETGQYADESITVHCYAPVVSKDAHTSLTRQYAWSIDKSADQTALTLSIGQQYLVNYSVTVDVTGFTDSNWAVSGTITVTNPHPSAAMAVSLSDTISPSINAVLDCGGTLNVPANGSATCGYSASLPNANTRTNTVTVTFNSINFTATAEVNFSSPTVNEVDECITVTDDQYGSLGTVCRNEAPKTFNYSHSVGPYGACGSYQYTNIASFVTNDTGATGSDSWTVDVTVPCGGCTLTQGYWKTHSIYGPAPYDDTWALIGENTPFYSSGKSYYQVLWTAPAGQVYYNLAHQYIAAKLNILNGAASTPAVDTALAWAQTFFGTHTPGDNLPRPVRQQVLANASLLDQYNSGLIGPGHCNE